MAKEIRPEYKKEILEIDKGKSKIYSNISELRNEIENIKDDKKFAKKTKTAWKRINAGKGIKMNFDNFVEEMKKW